MSRSRPKNTDRCSASKASRPRYGSADTAGARLWLHASSSRASRNASADSNRSPGSGARQRFTIAANRGSIDSTARVMSGAPRSAMAARSLLRGTSA